MASTVRGVNAMRNVIGGEVQCLDDSYLTVPLIIRDCTTEHLSNSDAFSFKIHVNTVIIATMDVNLCSRTEGRAFPQPDRHKQRFIKGILVNAYADFRLEVVWDDKTDSHETRKCFITVPHEWYSAYCSSDHAKW